AQRDTLLGLVDEDTRAYDAIVAARRLPKETPEEKSARKKAIDDATVLATTVPMQTAFFSMEAIVKAPVVLEKGNPNCASDAFVAALLLSSAVEGALANVRINLPGIGDPALAEGFAGDAAQAAAKASEAMGKVRALAKAKDLTA
ncbi:MAG: cyclodeaminase/cyclohydrolase family protein, partial [Thermoanaerobaculia bacterium]|nr:cyclodeaminase/cyclohydrolase family protein [Thermoanaerobaculia bacterium]